MGEGQGAREEELGKRERGGERKRKRYTERENERERGRDMGGRGSAHILPFLQRYLSGNDNMSVPVHMAITLDISADKVDTELPFTPLHRVLSFVCLFKGRTSL